MKGKALFRQMLQEFMKDREQIEQICRIYDEVDQTVSEDRRVRQKAGIENARKEGKALGRPKIQEPDNFTMIVEAWEQNRIAANEGARVCGMGISTFYRRIREMRDEELIQKEGRHYEK